MQDCVFCKIVLGEIPSYRIWGDDKFIAFLDLRPINDGHTLIIPRAHHEDVFDMPQALYQDMFAAARVLAPAIKGAEVAPKVGLVVEGFGVPHVHLHLVPIYEGNQLDPHKAHSVSPESLQEMQNKIKTVLP